MYDIMKVGFLGRRIWELSELEIIMRNHCQQ